MEYDNWHNLHVHNIHNLWNEFNIILEVEITLHNEVVYRQPKNQAAYHPPWKLSPLIHFNILLQMPIFTPIANNSTRSNTTFPMSCLILRLYSHLVVKISLSIEAS